MKKTKLEKRKKSAKIYALKTNQTAVYPVEVADYYLSMGLISELGELRLEVMKGCHPSRWVSEMGDVLWYISQLCLRFDLNFDKILFGSTEQKIDLQVIEVIAKISGHFKKYWRGDYERSYLKELVKADLEKVCALLKFIEDEYELDLEIIMQANWIKLRDRKENNTLKGEGNER